MDDCDCFPGILLVEEVEYLVTGEKTKICCDLYCQNTSRTELENFLIFIDSSSKEEYFQKRFGRYIELINLLKSHGLGVSYSETDMEPQVNYTYQFQMIFNVSTDKGDCLLIPRGDYGADNQYYLYVCPTLEKISDMHTTDSYFYQLKSVDVNSFNSYLRPKAWKFEYKNDEKFPQLLSFITDYIDHLYGQYGYYDEANNLFKNEKDVLLLIDKIKKQLEHTFFENLSIKTYSNNHTGPDFDIYTMFTPNPSWGSLTENHITDCPYPLDIYGIRFWYDRKFNQDKCSLSIVSKVCDFTLVANNYYSHINDGENEHPTGRGRGRGRGTTRPRNTYDPYVDTVKDIHPTYTFEGSYDECTSIMEQFLNQLILINC